MPLNYRNMWTNIPLVPRVASFLGSSPAFVAYCIYCRQQKAGGTRLYMEYASKEFGGSAVLTPRYLDG